jgi:segregation and condensation protein B
MSLTAHIESLIFAAESPIPVKEIKQCIEESLNQEFTNQEIENAIDRLIDHYKTSENAIEIVAIANGYQFMTKSEYHDTVGQYLKNLSRKKLSKAALETLAIIAYKQPVTRTELESIRGVGSDYTIQKLLEKDLVEISGRVDGPGRPLLYSTSKKFMDYFGLKDMNDLPKPKDFQMPENSIGEPAPIEQTDINVIDLDQEE